MKKMARYVNKIYEEIMRILKLGNVVMLFFFHICTNTKFKIHSVTVLPVLLYDGAIRPAISREAYRLRVLENNMLLKEL
jgi:hypothetical protein